MSSAKAKKLKKQRRFLKRVEEAAQLMYQMIMEGLRNLIEARETFKKKFSSLAPVLSQNSKPNPVEDQAIGTVAASQANFMRVIVNSLPLEDARTADSERFGVELLCVVKAVLKKIKMRVLVGDKVLVSSIDWVDRRLLIMYFSGRA
ncbi:small ribosomal subunit biogenesis GTPase RsgA 1 [Forsythia ovata]|uniref:Small ribosomal subunit biogenesis GTPase RsgA 1 n=1 Tax=Forsythia ovata TaxID=205694 RepID=A0ABD1W8H0_9LAMI